VPRCAFYQQRIRRRINHLIGEGHPAALHFGDPGSDGDLLVISSWLTIPERRIGYGQEKTRSLEVAVWPIALSSVAASALLEVDQIITVMDDSHRVSFSVADVKGRLRYETISRCQQGLLTGILRGPRYITSIPKQATGGKHYERTQA
jgi:hypothetical protein